MSRDIVDHAHDDKGMVLVEIHFRTLAGVDDILERQRMQAEYPSDLLDQRDIGQAGAIQPNHRPLVAMGVEIVDAGVLDGPVPDR